MYLENFQHQHFSKLFKSEVSHAKKARQEIDNDVLVLSLPPSIQTSLHHSLYAFEFHVRVKSAEWTLMPFYYGVAAIFCQHCH